MRNILFILLFQIISPSMLLNRMNLMKSVIVLYLLGSSEIISKLVPLANRFLVTEDSKIGRLSTESLLGTYLGKSSLNCARLCLFTPACLSFNYCDCMKCELSAGDVLSAGSEMQDNPSCRYTWLFSINKLKTKFYTENYNLKNFN